MNLMARWRAWRSSTSSKHQAMHRHEKARLSSRGDELCNLVLYETEHQRNLHAQKHRIADEKFPVPRLVAEQEHAHQHCLICLRHKLSALIFDAPSMSIT